MGNCNSGKTKSKDIETNRGTIILSNPIVDYSQKLYKILAIGESSVGKSSIGKFLNEFTPCIVTYTK